MVVISSPRLHTSPEIVGFIREADCTVRRVRVTLSDPSGVAIEEHVCFNDATNTAALSEEVAEYVARRANDHSDLEAVIIISDDD